MFTVLSLEQKNIFLQGFIIPEKIYKDYKTNELKNYKYDDFLTVQEYLKDKLLFGRKVKFETEENDSVINYDELKLISTYNFIKDTCLGVRIK